MLIPFALLISQQTTYDTVVEQRLTFTESGVKWRFDVMNARLNDEHFVLLYKNGKRVAGYGMPEEGVEFKKGQYVYGRFFKVFEPVVKAPFKVAAVRGHSGAGHGQDTLFLGFRNGKVFQMGRAVQNGGEYGGLVNWKGQPDHWVFDDYDYYLHYDLKESTAPFHHLLYRINKRGKLEFVRKWKVNHSDRLKDLVAPAARGVPEIF
ncbi:MAG: hypothetical protein KF784_10395 [Fimbriimonadaceae bacterium]|nr:hypothetical protein [Fimbriimonadaceae bacterium]